jgi:hypothetical protein
LNERKDLLGDFRPSEGRGGGIAPTAAPGAVETTTVVTTTVPVAVTTLPRVTTTIPARVEAEFR